LDGKRFNSNSEVIDAVAILRKKINHII